MKIPVFARVSSFAITVYNLARGNLLPFKGILRTTLFKAHNHSPLVFIERYCLCLPPARHGVLAVEGGDAAATVLAGLVIDVGPPFFEHEIAIRICAAVGVQSRR